MMIDHDINSAEYKRRFKILQENGWEDLWHPDNWVRTEYFKDPKIDVDRAGCSMEGAWCSLPENIRNE
jgi:hypothetical protein